MKPCNRSLLSAISVCVPTNGNEICLWLVAFHDAAMSQEELKITILHLCIGGQFFVHVE